MSARARAMKHAVINHEEHEEHEEEEEEEATRARLPSCSSCSSCASCSSRSSWSSRRPPSRLASFLAVGALGFVLQVVAFYLLVSRAAWPWLPATATAVELAVLHNFAWHQRWTWKNRAGGTLLGRLAAFHAANGFTSVAGNVVFMGMYSAWLHLPGPIAMTLAVGSTTLANFILADRYVFRAAAGAALVLASATVASAGEPRPATQLAWERYIGGVEAAMQGPSRAPFEAGDRRALQAGQVVVARACADTCAGADAVPSGTIQHWRGAVFIPAVSIDAVVEALGREPPRQDDVVRARVLERRGQWLRVYLRLARRAIVTVTYDTEHEMTFRRHSDGSATSRSVMTKVVEVDEAGTARERPRAAGDDRGFLWRLNAYGRYTAMEGGVLVALESVTLSRAVPFVLRPIAAPIISRIAQESMVRSLEAIRRRFVRGAD